MDRIRSAMLGEVRAVGFYDQDRLHRNDLEFFQFMAEVAEERGIPVYDANGLLSERFTWKIKARTSSS